VRNDDRLVAGKRKGKWLLKRGLERYMVSKSKTAFSSSPRFIFNQVPKDIILHNNRYTLAKGSVIGVGLLNHSSWASSGL
jgi:hypothetical protein